MSIFGRAHLRWYFGPEANPQKMLSSSKIYGGGGLQSYHNYFYRRKIVSFSYCAEDYLIAVLSCTWVSRQNSRAW